MEDRQNITLALPRDLLRKVKILAAKRETSVSSLLTDLMREVVARDDEYEKAMRRVLARARRGFDLGTHGRVGWTRDEIHDRRGG